MLSPEAREQIASTDQRRADRWEGRRPLVDSRLGSRTIGDMSIITEGCELFAKEDGSDDMRLRPDGEAVGGIVLDVTDVATVTDDGEIVQQRAFLVYDPHMPLYQAFTTLTERQVDPTRFMPPNIGRIRQAIRRMKNGVRDKGPITSEDVDLLGHAYHLGSVLMQRRTGQ